MPRFPFSSYLFRCRRCLIGFRIFEARSVPRNQSTRSPIFWKITPAGNGRSYPHDAHFISQWRRTLRARCRSVGSSSIRLVSCFGPSVSLPSFPSFREFRSETSLARSRYKLNFLPPPRISRREENFTVQRRKVQLCELGSLRWIDSMFSLTQVIHLSCLRRPRAIDPDVRRYRVDRLRVEISSIYRFSIGSLVARSFLPRLLPFALLSFSSPAARFSSLSIFLSLLFLPFFLSICPFAVLRFY